MQKPHHWLTQPSRKGKGGLSSHTPKSGCNTNHAPDVTDYPGPTSGRLQHYRFWKEATHPNIPEEILALVTLCFPGTFLFLSFFPSLGLGFIFSSFLLLLPNAVNCLLFFTFTNFLSSFSPFFSFSIFTYF